MCTVVHAAHSDDLSTIALSDIKNHFLLQIMLVQCPILFSTNSYNFISLPIIKTNYASIICQALLLPAWAEACRLMDAVPVLVGWVRLLMKFTVFQSQHCIGHLQLVPLIIVL